MVFEQLYINLTTINTNLSLVLLQVIRDVNEYPKKDEGVHWVVLLFAILFASFVVGGFFYAILKDFVIDTVIKGAPFSKRFKFTSKNLRLAYKIIGCHVVVAETGDRRDQYMFLISYLKRRFPDAESLNLKEIPNLHLIYPEIPKVINWLNGHLDEEHKLQFIDYMADLAFFNEKLNRREMRLIYYAGKIFGLTQHEVKSILSIRQKFYHDKRKREQEQRQKQTVKRRPSVNLKKQALQILGLSPSVNSLNEVKKGYRNLAKKHHPDRFHNESKQEKEKAHERFTEINTAYEYLSQVLK